MSTHDHLERSLFVDRIGGGLIVAFFCGNDMTGQDGCCTWEEVHGFEIRSGSVRVTLSERCKDDDGRAAAAKYGWKFESIIAAA